MKGAFTLSVGELGNARVGVLDGSRLPAAMVKSTFGT
jgi:hypothetical protein